MRWAGVPALILVAVSQLAGCINSDVGSSVEEACEEGPGSLLYTAGFADIYGLPPEFAVDLSDGLQAVRVYWTEYAHAEGRPYLQVQVYVDSELGSSLEGTEGTLAHYESYVRSGFEYFPAEPGLRTDPQRQHRQFYNRLILHSPELGTKTEAISRYKVDLAPGITAIEFSSAVHPPFDLYLYKSRSPDTKDIDPLFFALSRGEGLTSHRENFVRMQVPSELGQLPYRGCSTR